MAKPSRRKPPPPLTRTVEPLASAMVRFRWLLMTIGCLSFLPLAIWQSGLHMNRSLASLFAPSDPVLQDYQTLQADFGGNLVVMLVYDDEALMTAKGLARSREWTQRVEALEGVEGVLSIAKLVDAFAFLRPRVSLPILGVDGGGDVALFDQDDPVARDFRDLFAGYTHSADERTAAIVVMLRSDTDVADGAVSKTIASLRQTADEMPATANAMLIGEPVLLQDAFNLIIADGRRLAVGTIGLLCLVILITLRDWRVVMLSAMSITWSCVATRAAMVAMGIELSLVSAILVALVAVISVAAVMHIAVRCGDSPRRLFSGLAMLSIPIALTCLTDAAGFASLMVSSVRPVAEFGIMTATAAGCVLVSLMFFAPGVMNLSPRWNWLPQKLDDPAAQGVLQVALKAIVGISLRYRVALSAGSLVVLLISAWYVTRLETNASFLDNFRHDTPIVRAYSRVENRLGGAGVWDIVMPAPATITPAYLQRVRDLEDRLRSIGPVRLSKVLSLADADRVASGVALLSFATPEVRLAGMRAAIPTFAEALLTFPDAGSNDDSAPRRLRIMIRSEEALSGSEKAILMRDVQREVRSADPDAFVTGYSVLMSSLVVSLIRDQWKAMAVAIAAVGGLLWFATRSLALTLAALVVNTLPILVVLLLLGFFGGQLDLGSAMIGAVSIGLSIDGSIHFLSGYQSRQVDGESTENAAIEAASDLGPPILLASFALVIGFAVLVTSPFVPTSTFGLLVAATLALSAIANLTLLPAMVVWSERIHPH